MWIWWMVSLLILIACIIFAYRMIVSSYQFLPVDKRYFLGNGKNPAKAETELLQKDALKSLKTQVQSVEDNNTFYQIQLSKFQQRLKILEEMQQSIAQPALQVKDEEDWKEMYYEENEIKEKLENELDITKQKLEDAETKLKASSENNFNSIRLQSDYESSPQELQWLRREIDILQSKLAAATDREKDLEQLLIAEITVREKYIVLQKEYVQLQSEADELRQRIAEFSKKDMNLEMRLLRISELESKLSICEQEKLKLKSRLENHLLG